MVIVDHAFLDIAAHPAPAARPTGPNNPPAILEMTPIVVTPEDDQGFASQASLGDTPLALVSTANDSPGYPELQAQLMALSKKSRQFIAARSFHSIEMSQPDVIVAAIRAVLNRLPQP